MTPTEISDIRALAQKLLGLTEEQAKGLGTLEARPPVAVDAPHLDVVPGDVELWAAARRELSRLRARSRFLPREVYSESYWTVLIDLFDCRRRGREVSVTSACQALELPLTTALRHIGLLVSDGLVARYADPNDKRRTLLDLTMKGEALVRTILAAQMRAEIYDQSNVASTRRREP